MKYLKTFEGLFSFIKKNGISKYLITYKASMEELKSGRHSSKWDSKD